MENKKIKIKEVKKILEMGKKIKVKTINDQFTEIINYIEKGKQRAYEIILENGNTIKTTKGHRCFTKLGWLSVGELVTNEHSLLCDNGEYSIVKEIRDVGLEEIVDISVAHPKKCYFGNGILNHNTGKSYMAMQIATNALKTGMDVVYFDSESSLDPDFIKRMGIDVDEIGYIQAKSVEFVLQTIEDWMESNPTPTLFIWDSLAMTACEADIKGGFNPQSTIAMKPRILSQGFKKLTIPLANHGSAFLVLNQLYTNIPKTPQEALVTPYIAPGGLALRHSYSLAIWLKERKSKSSFVVNEEGEIIGSEVSARIEKSRFGTLRRQCSFKILWSGKTISVQDEESWFEAIKGSQRISNKGSWYYIHDHDGNEIEKFQPGSWMKRMKDEGFKNLIKELMDEHLIQHYAQKMDNKENKMELNEKKEQEKTSDS